LTSAGQATAVETTTNTVTVTEYAVATFQPTPFANGYFQAGSIFPWTITGNEGPAAAAGGIQLLKKQGVCTPNGICTESDLLRLTPPPLGYISILQTFDALPSTTYRVGLDMNAPSNIVPNTISIQAKYNQALIATHVIVSPNTTPYYPVFMGEFTTDSSGRVTLEIRVVRGVSSAGGFIYLDNVVVFKKL